MTTRQKPIDEPTDWPPGADVQAVYSGRSCCGFVEKRGAEYVATDATGALLGTFQTRAQAFARVLEAVLHPKKGAP